MKHAKRTLTLLLTAAMLTACLAGCGNTASDDPFDDVSPSQSDKGGENGEDTDPISGWESSDGSRGEKIMYGKTSTTDSGILRWGDMLFGITNYSNCYGYFSFDEPTNAKLLCFDPLCIHLPQQESCTSIMNQYIGEFDEVYYYPSGMYIDLYENGNAPVIYYYYLRDDIYSINIAEIGHREPVYCIERFDLSKGHREVVIDNVDNTIRQACNYGDYVYYVVDYGDDEGQMLYRIAKSGGEPQKLDRDENAVNIQILDAVGDKLFYTVNSRYIYRSDLDLTGSEKVLDMSEVKSEDGDNGVVAGSYSGYLYYFSDVETVFSGNDETGSSIEKCNLYRIPMSDLSQTPELVVEGMVYDRSYYAFSEKTLYYQPCVYKASTDRLPESAQYDVSGGKLYAMDLTTTESKLIVDEPGLVMYLTNAWDDRVLFVGKGCDKVLIHKDVGDGNHSTIAYASGEPYEIWCMAGAQGAVSQEYVESLQAIASAAREAYEAKQNAN